MDSEREDSEQTCTKKAKPAIASGGALDTVYTPEVQFS